MNFTPIAATLFRQCLSQCNLPMPLGNHQRRWPSTPGNTGQRFKRQDGEEFQFRMDSLSDLFPIIFQFLLDFQPPIFSWFVFPFLSSFFVPLSNLPGPQLSPDAGRWSRAAATASEADTLQRQCPGKTCRSIDPSIHLWIWLIWFIYGWYMDNPWII